MISKTQRLSAAVKKLNDGKWHHIAASMPEDGCKLSEVQIYVDGKPEKTKIAGADRNLHFNQSVRMSFGGMGFSHKNFDALRLKPFTGAMDDVSVWARTLQANEVVKLAQ